MPLLTAEPGEYADDHNLDMVTSRKRSHGDQGARRASPSTATRISNLRRMIAFLRPQETSVSTPEASADDLAKLLTYTKSGVRKYIAELREAEVLDLEYRGGTLKKLGQQFYSLTKDEDRISRFLGGLDDPEFGSRKRQQSPMSAATNKDRPGFFIHVLKDDAPHPVRRANVTVARDPWHFALFGNGPAPSSLQN